MKAMELITAAEEVAVIFVDKEMEVSVDEETEEDEEMEVLVGVEISVQGVVEVVVATTTDEVVAVEETIFTHKITILLSMTTNKEIGKGRKVLAIGVV